MFLYFNYAFNSGMFNDSTHVQFKNSKLCSFLKSRDYGALSKVSRKMPDDISLCFLVIVALQLMMFYNPKLPNNVRYD